MEVIVLTADELTKIIERTAAKATQDLRDDLERSRVRDLMNKEQLADYLGCDVSKINRYMRKGLPWHPFGSHPRFYRVDIDRWLKNERLQEIQRKAA